MNVKNYVVVIVTFLLLTFSIGSSVLNYMKSLEETQVELKERSLPLSIDNIYTEVQRNLIEPTLVSSMMANDTFLKDWLINEEIKTNKVTRYLESIKNRYSVFSTFLVSNKTGNYYTSKGFLEKIKKDNPANAWYYKFKDIQDTYEINLDFNKYLADSLIMFINYKIYDDDFHYLGATGIGIKISYIDDMLKHFRLKYNFNVFFTDKDGNILLSEKKNSEVGKARNIKDLNLSAESTLIDNSKVIEYKKDGKSYILNTKYIKELKLFLFVEAEVDKFTKELEKTFYTNLLISLIVTAIIILIILYTIKSYNKKLENLASYDSLTGLANRRSFNVYFEKSLKLFNRDAISRSVIFFDIDNFKEINDNHGHLIGDNVLIRIADILNLQIRDCDSISRWGGEEFLILLNDSNIDQSFQVAEKLRASFENDIDLNKLVNGLVTASFGVTAFKKDDTIDKIVSRADHALYAAKNSGKNRVEKEV